MIETLFYIAAGIALLATGMALSRTNAAHALIYLIVSLLAVAVIFFLIGAPFAAALEVVIYAGAIMVLFVFVIMMLNLGESGEARERRWLAPGAWLLPGLLSLILLAELLLLESGLDVDTSGEAVSPKTVGLSLFGPYVLAVELASMLLLAGLVGAYHVGRQFLARNRVGGTPLGGTPLGGTPLGGTPLAGRSTEDSSANNARDEGGGG